MDIFLLGGWVARPSAFLFFASSLVPCLILFALSFVVAMFNYIQSNRTLSPVPVLGMPSISALLDRYSLPNKITPCIFMHFLFTLLHSYAMFKLTN